MLAVYIIIGVVVVLFIIFIMTYNGLVRRRNLRSLACWLDRSLLGERDFIEEYISNQLSAI